MKTIISKLCALLLTILCFAWHILKRISEKPIEMVCKHSEKIWSSPRKSMFGLFELSLSILITALT